MTNTNYAVYKTPPSRACNFNNFV